MADAVTDLLKRKIAALESAYTQQARALDDLTRQFERIARNGLTGLQAQSGWFEYGAGTDRLDANGIQMKDTSGAGKVGIYGLIDLVEHPVDAAVSARWMFQAVAGNVNCAIGAFDVTNSRYAQLTAYANSNGAYVAPSSICFLTLSDGATVKTIATGAITVTSSFVRVETEGGAATDDLATITAACPDSTLLFLIPTDATHTVVVKHGTGNIKLAGGVDFTMDSQDTMLLLIFFGNAWHEIGRGG